MKTEGQYTRALANGGWKQYGKTVDEEMKQREEEAKFERVLNKPVQSAPLPQ